MKISIITPSYNQGSFIEKTILSVLNQPYPNIEYIIIDGGSTDNTVDIIKKYEDKIHYWCSEKDRGQSHALNKGFAKATGDVVAWINSDDYYEEGAFLKVMQLFKDPKVDVINGDCILQFQDKTPNQLLKSGHVDTRRLLRYWRYNFCPPQPSIFFRRDLFNEIGGIDEKLCYGMDLDLWLKMSKKVRFTYLESNLSYYLIHEDSKSGSGNGMLKFVSEWKQICSKHLIGLSLSQKIHYWFDYLLDMPKPNLQIFFWRTVLLLKTFLKIK